MHVRKWQSRIGRFAIGKGLGDFFFVTPWFGFQIQTYGVDMATLAYEVGLRLVGHQEREGYCRKVIWQKMTRIFADELYAR